MAVLHPGDFNKNVVRKAVSFSTNPYKLMAPWQKAAFGPTRTAERICAAPNHPRVPQSRRVARKTLHVRGLEPPRALRGAAFVRREGEQGGQCGWGLCGTRLPSTPLPLNVTLEPRGGYDAWKGRCGWWRGEVLWLGLAKQGPRMNAPSSKI